MSNFCAAINTQSAAMPYSEPVGPLCAGGNIDRAWKLCVHEAAGQGCLWQKGVECMEHQPGGRHLQCTLVLPGTDLLPAGQKGSLHVSCTKV